MEEATLSSNLARLGVNETAASPLQHVPYADVTVDYVKSLTKPTAHFLCKLSDNWAHLKFGGFKIRDMLYGITLVEVLDDEIDNDSVTDSDDPSTRVIKYHLGPDFLRLKTVGLTLTFSNGPLPINNMQMIERHY